MHIIKHLQLPAKDWPGLENFESGKKLHGLQSISGSVVITARKQGLQRLCFHRSATTPPLPGQTPLGRHSLYPVHAGIHTPCPVHAEIHTPCLVHAGRHTPPGGYYGIGSTSGQYASHWNAFL